MAAQRLPFMFRTIGTRLASTYILPLNPDFYSLQYRSRGSVIQTMNGNFENFFGMGVPQGQLRGTFGFRPRPQLGLVGVALSGQQQFKLFEKIFTAFYQEFQETVAKNNATWEFYDASDQHALRVRIATFNYERANNHQFLHRYDIQFQVLEDLLNPPAGSAAPSFLSQVSLKRGLDGLIATAGKLIGTPSTTVQSSVQGTAAGESAKINGET